GHWAPLHPTSAAAARNSALMPIQGAGTRRSSLNAPTRSNRGAHRSESVRAPSTHCAAETAQQRSAEIVSAPLNADRLGGQIGSDCPLGVNAEIQSSYPKFDCQSPSRQKLGIRTSVQVLLNAADEQLALETSLSSPSECPTVASHGIAAGNTRSCWLVS